MENENNRRNALDHVPTCSAWPPPWLKANTCEHADRTVAVGTPPGKSKGTTTEPPPILAAAPVQDIAGTELSSVLAAPAVPGDARVDAKPERLPCGIPADAVIVVADAYGNTDRVMKGPPNMWCWIGGPTWFYVTDFPIPKRNR